MKKFKLLATMFLCLVLAVSMFVSVSAATITKGSITIQNPTIGTTYKLYRVFDLKISDAGDSYTYKQINAGYDFSSLTTYFDKDTEGNITAKAAAQSGGELSDGAISAIKAYITANSISATYTKTVASTDIDSKGCVKFADTLLGFYYMESVLNGESTAQASVTVDTTTPNTTIYNKNAATPTPDPDPDPDINPSADPSYKYVKKHGEVGALYDTEASVEVNKEADFKVVFEAVNYVTKDEVSKQVTKYIIEDTATGISSDWTNTKLTIAGVEKTLGTDYTVSSITNGNKIEITWVNGDDVKYVNSTTTVVLTYTAKVTSCATNNTNTAKVSYLLKGESTPTELPTANNQTKVGNYTITVKNFDGTLLTSPILSGATFKLMKGGSQVAVIYDETISAYRPVTGAEAGTNIAAGDIVIKGLEAGTYSVVEVDPATGYNRHTDITGKTVTKTIDKTTTTAEADFFNTKGVLLPGTGSVGTTIFVLLGTAAILGAGLFLVTNVRMKKEND